MNVDKYYTTFILFHFINPRSIQSLSERMEDRLINMILASMDTVRISNNLYIIKKIVCNFIEKQKLINKILINSLQDCAALLAYEQPQQSSVGYLLSESQREIVADTVNAMILSTNPNVEDSQGCLHSYLERLLRQLTACYLERRSLNGDQGEAFQLRRVLNCGKKD